MNFQGPLKTNIVQQSASRSSASPNDSAKKKIKANLENPYAHIAPPAVYKAPPPNFEEVFVSPLAASTSDDKGLKLPLTHSRKKELLRSFHDNG